MNRTKLDGILEKLPTVHITAQQIADFTRKHVIPPLTLCVNCGLLTGDPFECPGCLCSPYKRAGAVLRSGRRAIALNFSGRWVA